MDKKIYINSLRSGCAVSILLKVVIMINLLTGWEDNLHKIAGMVFVDIGLFTSMIFLVIKRNLLKNSDEL